MCFRAQLCPISSVFEPQQQLPAILACFEQMTFSAKKQV